MRFGRYTASMTVAPAHFERHGARTQTIRDLVLGMADGLTVPFFCSDATRVDYRL